ncbi:26026_t:CDS:2, partial [Gigaspora margarita]
MSTSPKAETAATAAQYNILQQRRLNNYDNLIDFEPQEYDNGEEDNDRMVIIDPDDVLILSLHDIVTDNHYINADYQDEYEKRYLQQRADRTYTYEYRRLQINDPIVDPLEPGTQPKNNCFLQTPQVRFDNPSLLPQRCSPTPVRTPPTPRRTAQFLNDLPQPLPAHGAAAANPMDQLIQSMNNLILAMENNANQPQETKVVKFSTFSSAELRAQQQGLGETVDEYYDELERLYHKADPMGKYLQIDRICQFVDSLRQKLREPVEMECPTTLQQALKKAKAAEAAYSRGGPLSSYLLKRSYLSQENSNNEELNELKKAIFEMAQNMKILIQKQNENKKPVTNSIPNLLRAMSTQPYPYQSNSSNSRLNQPLPDKLLSPLVLNSNMEMPDVSKLAIEVIYYKAVVEQYPIYLILDTEKTPSRNCENLLIEINKVVIPIDVEVTEAREYTMIVETDWLARNDIRLGETDGINELEEQQQVRVEELVKANKKLFAEGLTQLERTQEKKHQIR